LVLIVRFFGKVMPLRAPRTSPDQWVALAAVVDHGSYQGAAAILHRSASTLNYQVQRLQQALGVALLEVRGRRAVLTPHGATLLQRARGVLAELESLEAFAGSLQAGFEPALTLVVDAAYPRDRLLRALAELKGACPQTRLELEDAVLSGAEDAIVDARADVVITARVPRGVLGDWLYETTFVAVAAPSHALHALERPATGHDLARHTQVVLRDSGTRAPRDEGFLGADVRWTVGSLEASRAAVVAGLAYAWLPEHVVADDLAAGRLRPLAVEAGATRRVPLYLVLVHAANAGPAARIAAEVLHRHSIGGAAGADS
jgi:DNA-binding transcriptional LysR family regulator